MKINRGRRPLSLRVRLTCFISLVTIMTFAAFAGIMLHSVQEHFAEQDIKSLQKINSTFSGMLENIDESKVQKMEEARAVLAGYQHISVVLLDSGHQVLYRSANAPDLRLAVNMPDFNQYLNSGNVFLWSDTSGAQNRNPRGDIQHTTYRLIASSLKPASTLVIALSIDFHLHYLDALKHNLLIIATVMSLLIIIIIFLAVHKGHQPLRNVSEKIKNITSENLDVRLRPEYVPIELEQLVISFNHMIARIEDVFTRQANFSTDIAHEMRTPITNLVTQTEIALSQKRTEKELEEVLFSSLEEYNRMSKMVSDMLFLAQADNNQLIPEHLPLDLQVETTKVFDFFEAWAEEREVGLRFEGQSCMVKGDLLMLRRVINNLLSNAIRYTPTGKAVTVHLHEKGQWVELTVENPGTPVAPEHLPQLFDRFYRADPSRQRKGEGSGIGLAIVKSIIEAHQGKISVASDEVSTRFTFLLPRMTS
ncbi:heavy metal sensor histidine kinase [Salmonella enterica subsp. enterica serovar Grumpensis]|nr:heavy metal sensor histidine kinase [Salmonella enterica subsp. enterica serovar Grumpensis]